MRLRALVPVLLSLAVLIPLSRPAIAADRPARTLTFAEGTPIDRIDIGALDDVKDKGKKFVGNGQLVLLDETTSLVSVKETVDKKGRSTFLIKTAKRAKPKLVMKFKTSGDPASVFKAKTTYISVTKSKLTLKDTAHFGFAPAGFALGLNAVPEDATDDVPLRLGFGSGALPASKSWASTLPPIGDQGQQGSCVGWSSAYYVKTSWENRSDAGWNSTAAAGQFSPAFVYNQINGGQDGGSQPSDAMQLMVDKGAASLAAMPYSQNDFRTQPSAQVLAAAASFKNIDARFFGNTLDVGAIKQYLADTGPLVFGIKVDDGLQQGVGDYTQFVGPNLGGHAIACVGYDDNRSGGAFLFANSWGAGYRDQGFVWATYQATADMFLGAWAMVDGPNSGGGGGGEPGAPSGFTASNGQSNGYVALGWQIVPNAAGFRLERQAQSGAWQTIANPQADMFHHQDFDVAPDGTYSYRLAGVDGAGAVGPYAYATGSTSSGAVAGGSITLTASNPNGGGTAYPDRIALSWNTIGGNPYYAVLRSDSEEGFRNGQYIVLGYGQGMTAYSDYVAPRSRFAYLIAALDASTYDLLATSDTSLGATSGSTGAALDIGIIELDESVVVERGFSAPLDVYLFNYGAPSSHQIAYVGMYYYFADGTTGILSYADAFEGSVPIWYELHDESPMQTYDYGLLETDPYAPVYIPAEGSANVGFWWYVEVYPSNSNADFLEDVDFDDNVIYGNELLFVL